MFPAILLLAAAPGAGLASAPAAPIALHPANPRIFIYRGKPTVLVGSGEHYGAVLNLDFDYHRYLDTLQRAGLNLTRTFSGVYCEDPRSFNIQHNTLAPAPGRYVTPWARSVTPGYPNGGSKFDLTKWDNAYWHRLRDFCAEAERRGVIIEYVLFCPYYEDAMWRLSPMNAANNVNGIGAMPRGEVYTLDHPELLAVQDTFVRKAAAELRDVPNLYYEICNEPYFGGVTLAWQRHVADTLARAEAGFPHRHLIAQNIANETAKVTDPLPAVSTFNFHYASPPVAVAENWALNRPIAFDETGFAGSADATYRAQAWEFLLAGGAVFDNLDYSFTVAHPDGTAPVQAPTPGGGSPTLRRQLAILRRFMDRLDLVHMQPESTLLPGALPGGAAAYALAGPDSAALYLRGGPRDQLTVTLPAGRWRPEWTDVITGAVTPGETVDHRGGPLTLPVPHYGEDIALRLTRVK